MQQIRDSLGRPTVEATVFSNRAKAVASTASGTSVGEHEAVFAPKPVPQLIVQARRSVVPRLIGEQLDLKKVDADLRETDGTHNFSKVGAAVSTAISAAVAKLAAKKDNLELYEYLNPKAKRYELPRLLCKMIGGGLHATRGPSFQEFLAAPLAGSFADKVKACKTMHAATRKTLEKHAFAVRKDAEGGWTGAFTSRQAASLLFEAFEGLKIHRILGIDAAAGTLYAHGKYAEDGLNLLPAQHSENLLNLCNKYVLSYVEDPFHDQAFRAFAEFRRTFSGLTCADDLVATSLARLKRAIRLKACGAVIIKPNQAGVISEACDVIRLAEKHGILPIPSHRSGETTDTTIAHLAVAFSCPFVKMTLAGEERQAKIRELLRIERLLK